jgi:hypothetical protein
MDAERMRTMLLKLPHVACCHLPKESERRNAMKCRAVACAYPRLVCGVIRTDL